MRRFFKIEFFFNYPYKFPITSLALPLHSSTLSRLTQNKKAAPLLKGNESAILF